VLRCSTVIALANGVAFRTMPLVKAIAVEAAAEQR